MGFWFVRYLARLFVSVKAAQPVPDDQGASTAEVDGTDPIDDYPSNF